MQLACPATDNHRLELRQTERSQHLGDKVTCPGKAPAKITERANATLSLLRGEGENDS